MVLYPSANIENGGGGGGGWGPDSGIIPCTCSDMLFTMRGPENCFNDLLAFHSYRYLLALVMPGPRLHNTIASSIFRHSSPLVNNGASYINRACMGLAVGKGLKI